MQCESANSTKQICNYVSNIVVTIKTLTKSWYIYFCIVYFLGIVHYQHFSAVMRNALLLCWLTTVQAACGVKKGEGHKCIQRSLFQSSSSPQLQYNFYFQRAPGPENTYTDLWRVWLLESKWLLCRCNTNQILECSNKGRAKTALIQVFCITQIYEFMNKLQENRK